jgi:hypothetical protein
MNLSESTFEELYKSTVLAFPNTTKRQYAVQPLVVEELRWMPFVGMKTLFIKGTVRNEDRQYGSVLLIKDVDYTGNELKITASDGLEYQMKKLSLENSEVLVRCSCPDFSWRFNYYNHLDSSLYGKKRKKYEHKGGPVANPQQLPGLCKHLIKLISSVHDAGIFHD